MAGGGWAGGGGEAPLGMARENINTEPEPFTPPIQSDIDLAPRLTTHHSSAHTPWTQIAIGIIAFFIVEKRIGLLLMGLRCIWSGLGLISSQADDEESSWTGNEKHSRDPMGLKLISPARCG